MIERYSKQQFENGQILDANKLINIENGIVNIENTIYNTTVSEDYYSIKPNIVEKTTFRITGVDTEYDGYNRTDYIKVSQGENYKIVSTIASKVIPMLVFFDSNKQFLGYEQIGDGDYKEYTIMYVVPEGVSYIIAQCANGFMGAFFMGKYKKSIDHTLKFHETHSNSLAGEKYGVRWNLNNPDDLGERIYNAKGLNAKIGIGPTNGYSDFDNIYPWCMIKRCNIKTNSNGATIVTYEGDSNFKLDGSNGDVFVRIPKFYYERYIENDYEHRIISQAGANVHPAFIEDGIELDEIFISAFEGTVIDNKLHSYGDVLPSMNITPVDFLQYAKNNGIKYSLYDNRCVDMLFTLMAVEYGCRNSNRVIGWGIADYWQNIAKTGFQCILPAQNTNTIRTNYKDVIKYIHVDDGICICANNDQNDILTHAILTDIYIPDDNSYIDFTFDGNPINVDETCFFGSGPMKTNWCESCNNPLNYHTGRADIKHTSEKRQPDVFNPCRYRWIENPVGNVWHYLPDITFKDLQMYVCKNMRDYEICKYELPYEPIGDTLIDIGSDNGNKGDVIGYNYWITKLGEYDFAKGVVFGKEFNKDLVSTQSFGAYYYLSKGIKCISNGGGFDHLWRCNILTNRAWQAPTSRWYLYGARLMYKNIQEK